MTRPCFHLWHAAVLTAVLIFVETRAAPVIAQTANSNAGLAGGQNSFFDAVLATPQQRTPFLPDNVFATAPGLEQPARAPQFTLNALAPALFNSNAQFLKSGGSNAFEGSPLIRLGWASQLFDTPTRISGAASFETERFVNGPGAAIDYIRPSARAQYTNPQNDQDFSPYLSYVPRLDFDPTFANNFATRQDINFGIDKVFKIDGALTGCRLRPVLRARRCGRSASTSARSSVSATRAPISRVLFQSVGGLRHFRPVEHQLFDGDNAPLV